MLLITLQYYFESCYNHMNLLMLFEKALHLQKLNDFLFNKIKEKCLSWLSKKDMVKQPSFWAFF
ncbi:hypothetical protein TI04_00035 [Achromatium sp. WMS2]|nr:hypothetical protein TI04_00035 [Achromatium sp. WMS2]